MAKLKMKKVEILAPIEQIKVIVEFIQRRGIIELSDYDDDSRLQSLPNEKSLSNYDRYHKTAEEALSILDNHCPEKHGLIESFIPTLQKMSVKDFVNRSDLVSDYLQICYSVIASQKAIEEADSECSRLSALMKNLEPWLELDIPMKNTDTRYTCSFIGSLPAAYDDVTLQDALTPILGDCDLWQCSVISSSKTRTNIFAVCHSECRQELFAALRELGFSYPTDPTKHPPKVRYERLLKEVERYKKQKAEAEENIVNQSSHRDDLRFLVDYLTISRDKYETLSRLGLSNNIFVLNGYIAEKDYEVFAKELEEKFTAVISSSDPEESEDVPVKLENNGFAAAVEPITEMYSMPGKDDIDPNPVMAFFYYMLFGIMLSDAGYGLLMVIGTAIAKFKFKPTGRFKKTVDMYFYCGLATVFWGALFGSWFGDIVTVIAKQFLGKTDFPGVALWFEPVSDPMKLMLYSFLFGIIHLFFGLGASFVKMWNMGNKIGAVCDVIPVYLLITGVAPIAAGILIDTIPPVITTVGKYLALSGVILIVLTAGRDSKNIVGKLGLGLYGLYNVASGWLSDILSYSRLLALGLCTGVIATVINTLGTIPENKVTKACLLVPVFIFGHAVNMAINLIGTYVHTNRLQFVEFFAKFYEGGGRSFTPLKINTKYYQFKED